MAFVFWGWRHRLSLLHDIFGKIHADTTLKKVENILKKVQNKFGGIIFMFNLAL